jgi:hypothetical protein
MLKQIDELSKQNHETHKSLYETKIEFMLWKYADKHAEIKIKNKE